MTLTQLRHPVPGSQPFTDLCRSSRALRTLSRYGQCPPGGRNGRYGELSGRQLLGEDRPPQPVTGAAEIDLGCVKTHRL